MKQKRHSIVSNILHLLGMAYKHYKIVFLFILLEMICNGLLPLFGLYLPKMAVELVLNNKGLNHALMTLGGFATVYVLVQCINSVAAQGKYPFQNNLRFVYAKALFEKSLDCDYAVMETSEGQTWYEKARSTINWGDGSATSQMFYDVTSLISNMIYFAFIFSIISRLSLYILSLIVVLSVLNYFLYSFALRYENSQREVTGDLRKKSFYLERAISDITAVKDIRIYNLSSLFVSIRETLLQQMFKVYTKIKNRYFLSSSLKLLITVCRDGVAYAYCIRQVLNGTIAIPHFVLYLSAIASFSTWLNGIVSNILTLKRENTALNDLRAFFEYTNQFDAKNPISIKEIQGPIEIEFKNVSFRYTEDSPKILDGLSFHIRPNEKIALVG